MHICIRPISQTWIMATFNDERRGSVFEDSLELDLGWHLSTKTVRQRGGVLVGDVVWAVEGMLEKSADGGLYDGCIA